MNKFIILGLLLNCITSITSAHIIDEENAREFSSSAKPINPQNYQKATNSKRRKRLIRHIVLFDLKEDGKARKKEIIRRFLSLRDSKYIHNIEAGSRNISREGVGKGYDLAFIVTFLSKGDLNFYVGTPAIDDARFYDAKLC